MKVAVMGCVVNGPGRVEACGYRESLFPDPEKIRKHLSMPMVNTLRRLKGPGIAEEFIEILGDFVRKRYGAGLREVRRATGPETV